MIASRRSWIARVSSAMASPVSGRVVGLSPEQQTTLLAGRPYDLRHACATLLLNAGVPPKEVARRLGHSVEVLWKVYAGCLDGDEERINRMIEAALAA
jgi:integrase